MILILLMFAHGLWATQMLLQDARHLVKVVPYTRQQKIQAAKGIINIVVAVLLN